MLAELVGKRIEADGWSVSGTFDVLAYEDGMLRLKYASYLARKFPRLCGLPAFWTTVGSLGRFRVKEVRNPYDTAVRTESQ